MDQYLSLLSDDSVSTQFFNLFFSNVVLHSIFIRITLIRPINTEQFFIKVQVNFRFLTAKAFLQAITLKINSKNIVKSIIDPDDNF